MWPCMLVFFFQYLLCVVLKLQMTSWKKICPGYIYWTAWNGLCKGIDAHTFLGWMKKSYSLFVKVLIVSDAIITKFQYHYYSSWYQLWNIYCLYILLLSISKAGLGMKYVYWFLTLWNVFTQWMQFHFQCLTRAMNNIRSFPLKLINPLAPGRCGSNFKSVISKHMSWIKFMSTSTEYLWWQVNIGSGNFTWANVDPDLCRHMVSLGCNELILLLYIGLSA